jgi:hypothetical protein
MNPDQQDPMKDFLKKLAWEVYKNHRKQWKARHRFLMMLAKNKKVKFPKGLGNVYGRSKSDKG